MVTGFTLFSGSVYVASFNYGDVASVEIDGVKLNEAFTSGLSASQYYWDYENSLLYVRTSGGVDPDTLNTIVTYNIYVGTYDAYYFLNPSDLNSRIVYYEPYIKNSPSIKFAQSSNLYGFMPTQSSSIKLSNAEHFFERHLYDSSFNNAEIYIYHYLGLMPVSTNIKLVYSGYMGSVSYSSDTVDIKTFSEISIFDKEFRNPTGANFYTVSLSTPCRFLGK
jgi:hypothetical protein